MRTFIACLIFGVATVSAAQDVLIRGAMVHTGTSPGTLQNTDVLLRNGRIEAVGTQVAAAEGTTIVEAKGRPVTAGLFGGLSAIGIEEVTLEGTTADANLLVHAPPFEADWRPEFDVTTAFNPRSVLVPVARIEGLTWTVLAPGSMVPGGNLLAGQGAGVTLDGRYDAVLGPSRTLFINIGGSMNPVSDGSRAGQWMLLDQAIHEARTLSGEERAILHPLGREALAKYLEGGRVVFNVDRAAEIRRVVAYAKRNGMRPVVAGGAEAWVVADYLARENVPVLIDSLSNLPYTFDAIGARLDNAARLHRAGVRIAFTQFGESHNARKIRQLAGNAVAHGLPADVALLGLTRRPAEIFGLTERGTIARGQIADVVLWSGDPLEVTTSADQVWIAGRPVDMKSRQSELRDKYLRRLQPAP